MTSLQKAPRRFTPRHTSERATNAAQVDTTYANADYKKQLEAAAAKCECPFCDGSETWQKIEPNIVAEVGDQVAFPRSWPVEGIPHYFMILPRTHIENYTGLSIQQLEDTFTLARQVAVENEMTSGAFCMRFGVGSGQTIFHSHAHLMDAEPIDPEAAQTESFDVLRGSDEKIEARHGWRVAEAAQLEPHARQHLLLSLDRAGTAMDLTPEELRALYVRISREVADRDFVCGAVAIRWGQGDEVIVHVIEPEIPEGQDLVNQGEHVRFPILSQKPRNGEEPEGASFPIG